MADKILFSIEIDNDGAIRKIDQTRRAIGEDLPASTKKASAGFSRLTKTLAMVGTAFAAIGIARLVGKFVDLGGAVIRTGAQFETMAIQMRAVTGSADAAQKATDWIVQFTADTPYQIEQVTNAFVRMRAMGLDPMDGTMQAVADMTSFLGGSMETMNSIVLALGKSYTVGKMSMEEMRMMMERGVPVIDILAEKLGVTNQKIVEMSSKGKLGRESIQLLIEGMGELAGGASASLMDSFAGMWSNLQDQITLALKELSEGGALDGAKKGLRELLDALQRVRESGKLEEWGRALGEIFNSVSNALSTVIDNLGVFLNAYYTFTGGIWAATAKIAKVQELYVKLAKSMVLSADARRSMQDLADTLEDISSGAEDFSQGAADALAGFSGKIREVVVASEDLSEAMSGGGSTEGLAEAIDVVIDKTRQYLTVGDQFFSKTQTYITRGMAFGNIMLDVAESFRRAEIAGSGMAVTTDRSFDAMSNSFSDLISKGFTGELESFSDIWENIWADMAKSMTTILGKAIEDAFKGGGNIFENMKEAWTNLKKAIEDDKLGAAISGAGGIYAGYQQGGAGGFLQGALGGLQLGGSIGSVFGATGLGMGIGALVGGVASLFGGKDDPKVYGHLGLGGHQVYQQDTDLSTRARAVWANERISEYRSSIMGMNDVLRLFEDGGLFALIGDAPEFTFNESDLGEITAIFSNDWLPKAMREMFKGAINRGLRNFGVDDETRKKLWQEIRTLAGADQIAALETYISALVNTSHLLDDMDWNAIIDASREDSMTSFLNNMAETLSGVQNQMLGLDSMSLLERAEQASTIEQMIVSARQAEIQMLQQIDQIQKSINDSLNAQIEGIRLGGMSEGEQQGYYLQQIQDVMAQLRAGVSSPEAVQALMADLQRYTGAYQNLLGEDLYMQSGFGGTEADWIIGILEEARGLSNEAFEAMRDQIKESNDALVAELQKLIEALTHYGDTIATTDATPQDLDVNGTIDININAGDGFWASVDARFDYLFARRWEIDNGIN